MNLAGRAIPRSERRPLLRGFSEVHEQSLHSIGIGPHHRGGVISEVVLVVRHRVPGGCLAQRSQASPERVK